ncbi:MAG: sensor histidine kinase [Flavisolibacter sp.]
MPDQSRKKIRAATILYWVLLVYIISALVWWALELLHQSEVIYKLKLENLQLEFADTDTPAYRQELDNLNLYLKREYYKYIGEGATFLVMILIGAVYIYRSVRRQLQLHRQQQNFVMAITHELKTPIAVSRLNLETLQKYDLDSEKKEKLLKMTLQENLRLDNLINNILISSQLEANRYRIEKEQVNLSELVTQSCRQFTGRYPFRPLNENIEEDLAVNGDKVLLKLLLSNLLENAHKYSPSEVPVTISLKQEQQQVCLVVADRGEGIPDNEKKNIFKKFYRIGSEKTRKTQGTGLGLFISKKIVRDHKGLIWVEDNYPSGSKFIIQLPLQ